MGYPTVAMLSCAGCSGVFVMDTPMANDGSFKHPGMQPSWFCARCSEPIVTANAAWVPEKGDRCHQDAVIEGPFSELFVVFVDGDHVTVQPIGFPERRRTVHRRRLRPGRFGVR